MLRTAFASHVRSHHLTVLNASMHYWECGMGDPIVFLHGNPTSSYLWRNIMPQLEAKGRCIAIDCIGMGQSGKPDIGYYVVDHMSYIDALIAALSLDHLTFVAHDWGVVMALWYARRHPQRVRAIAFMEGHIHPILQWTDFDAGSEALFKQLRTQERGRQLIIAENFFIETVLPGGTQRVLTEAEMNAYRAPYLLPHTRFPLWRWVNEIPIEGHPKDVHAIVVDNQAYLRTSDIPKLLLYAEPGAVIQAAEVAWCHTSCRNFTAVHLGSGLHFLPEDHPDTIGAAVANWIDTIET